MADHKSFVFNPTPHCTKHYRSHSQRPKKLTSTLPSTCTLNSAIQDYLRKILLPKTADHTNLKNHTSGHQRRIWSNLSAYSRLCVENADTYTGPGISNRTITKISGTVRLMITRFRLYWPTLSAEMLNQPAHSRRSRLRIHSLGQGTEKRRVSYF